ncbi:hypothetical protein EJ08DRAFT_692092 [Tothia fuscella]|uniref:Zinc transporter n=1 Tax=Tothia fuscella TaxID=1048955 RepID=A0A9P4P0Z6_9PEZI|nr:hypothetical protein EJ08DRAFT_692092 [Tothia fuscella]
MGGRTRLRRGDSDLGRPTPVARSSPKVNGFAFSPIAEHPPKLSAPRATSPFTELVTGVLIPLPFLLASLAFLQHTITATSTLCDPDAQGAACKYDALPSQDSRERHYATLVQACGLAAAALLVIGTIARIRISPQQTLDRRKDASSGKPAPSLLRSKNISPVLKQILCVGLPYYAALQLGGGLTSLITLLAISSGIAGVDLGTIRAHKLSCAVMILCVLCDWVLIRPQDRRLEFTGSLALFLSVLAVPLLTIMLNKSRGSISKSAANGSTSAVPTPPMSPRVGFAPGPAASPTKEDVDLTLLAGIALAVFTFIASFVVAVQGITTTSILFSAASVASMAGLALFAQPSSLQSANKYGVAAGCASTAIFGFLYSSHSWTIPLVFTVLSTLGYVAAVLDGKQLSPPHSPHHKNHDHHSPDHHKSHDHSSKMKHSRLTGALLKLCTSGSIMDTIMRERDTRRIAYFGCLNLGFMIVQFFYGFVTGSLGLLTDSIHMLFDCLGLGVGLAAAVMSKWPPSVDFPYGYGKIDTLSGFANGIFLILVSIEIVFDAIHRLHEGHELRRLNELLLISILGFLVNIVGLTAFGHAHHGHGHDHSHDHSHGHEHTREPHQHSHDHAHSHATETHSHSHESHDHDHCHDEKHAHADHDHAHLNGHSKHLEPQPSPLPSLPPTPFSIPPTPGFPPSPVAAPHSHSHDHSNENMQGIFLHILADALGSVAVIISTLLTKYDNWSGWDPLASCAIAVLIFFSAIPLVKSSGMRLLLSLPSEKEYACRDTLHGVSELRGVVGYAGVRFWVGDKSAEGEDGTIIQGVVHVIAATGCDMDDLRERTALYLKGRGVDAIVHVEREGDGSCWCGGTSGQVRN